jgi:hypothetical protein
MQWWVPTWDAPEAFGVSRVSDARWALIVVLFMGCVGLLVGRHCGLSVLSYYKDDATIMLIEVLSDSFVPGDSDVLGPSE